MWRIVAGLSFISAVLQALWVMGFIYGAGLIAWKSGAWPDAASVSRFGVLVFFGLTLLLATSAAMASHQLPSSAFRRLGRIAMFMLVAFGAVWGGMLLSPIVSIVNR